MTSVKLEIDLKIINTSHPTPTPLNDCFLQHIQMVFSLNSLNARWTTMTQFDTPNTFSLEYSFKWCRWQNERKKAYSGFAHATATMPTSYQNDTGQWPYSNIQDHNPPWKKQQKSSTVFFSRSDISRSRFKFNCFHLESDYSSACCCSSDRCYFSQRKFFWCDFPDLALSDLFRSGLSLLT